MCQYKYKTTTNVSVTDSVDLNVKYLIFMNVPIILLLWGFDGRIVTKNLI